MTTQTPDTSSTSTSTPAAAAAAAAEVLQGLPQRPPFLFVDHILARTEKTIQTTKYLSGQEDFFQGHFPGQPIMPGVLLCEAVFQTGALLMAASTLALGEQALHPTLLGVVTRIESTRFKNFAHPGDTLMIEVELEEQLQNAFYMKGQIRVGGEMIMSTRFTCALVTPPPITPPPITPPPQKNQKN